MMSNEEIQQEITYYFVDIREYSRTGDFKSAVTMAHNLTQFIIECQEKAL